MGTEDERGPSDADGDHTAPVGGHRFPAERRHVLKNAERLRWLPPEPLLRASGIQPGEVAVDIGAGTGFWTLPLSRLVGPAGLVYAVDVEPVMLEELRTLVTEKRLTNVQVVGSSEREIPLSSGIADVAVAGFVVHEPADPPAFLSEIVRLLRPGGRLIVVDWHKRPTEDGPPLEQRLAQREVEAFLGDAGLAVEQRESPNADIYVVRGRLITDHSV
ncbi:MAG: class I SAM-dependent methyltransferase [Acidimicrobiales bacterium]